MSGDLTRSFNGSTDDKLDRIISLVQSLDSRVAGLETTVQGLDPRMSVLEEKVDARLRETQPLWERVLAEITQLRGRQDHSNSRLDQLGAGLEQLRAGQEQLRAGLDELRKDTKLGLQKVERQIMQLSKYFLEQRADIVMLQDRIEKLEGENI